MNVEITAGPGMGRDGVGNQERRLVKAFRALGDPTRLRLVHLLVRRGEMGCADLANSLGLSRSTLSHHTRVLEEAGLILMRREGPYHFYRVHREELARIAPALFGLEEGDEEEGDEA